MVALVLDRTASIPFGAQLATQIRARILDGRLAEGSRLPSTRAVAADLGVSRSVVEQAYAQLVAEGWLVGRRGAGTLVAASAHLATPPARRRDHDRAAPLVRLDAGTAWTDPRHAASWRRAWREVGTASAPRGYDDARGLPALREALAERLNVLRGLDVDADDIRICAGATDALRHLLAAAPIGDVLMEDPGYRAAAATVRLAGRRVIDHPALARVEDLTGCAAAYVTPAHQHPLGPAMPGAARLALLDAARRAGAVVIEDDYDSEFRYDVAPLPALASLDPERVGYVGTASKSVMPALRLGWFVAPPHLTERIDRTRRITHDTASWPVQRAFVSLLRDGYVDRVVRAARRVYAERAARVAAALPGVTASGTVAGMYACLELDAATTQRAHAAGREAGFEIPLLAHYCRSAERHGLIIGFGGCTDDELDRALSAIATVTQAAGRAAGGSRSGQRQLDRKAEEDPADR